ncbi:MAG TPA: DUF47 family protein [Vicinamibacterales bacterium]
MRLAARPLRAAKGDLVKRWRLIPREEAFFEDFVKLAVEIQRAAGMFREMVAPEQPVWERAEQIHEIEHRCDAMTRGVLERLHRTFVTPLDREDIHALALSLDDVADSIDDVAGLLRLYRINEIRPGVRDLSIIIDKQSEQLVRAMEAMRDRHVVSACTAEIDRLEHDADILYRQAVEALFADERDPIAVIKWKEIYEYLEATTDRCEDVSNVLDGILLKHA